VIKFFLINFGYLNYFLFINFINNINYYLFNHYLGIGDWGLGIGDWGLGPIPHPQSPIPILKIKI